MYAGIFLDAGRAFTELEVWALEWKERIGTLYHLNKQRLEHWDCERSLTEQSEAFKQQNEALKEALQHMHKDATNVVDPDAPMGRKPTMKLKARTMLPASCRRTS